MRTLASLGRRDGARVSRILAALQRSSGAVCCDALAACGGVTRYELAGLVKVLRGEGFVVEYNAKWERDRRYGVMRRQGYYRMNGKK